MRAQRSEDGDEVVDVLACVRSRELDPEAHLVFRHERVGRDRDVDAVFEQISSNLVDLVVVGERDFDHGETARIGGPDAELLESREDSVGVLPQAEPNLVASAAVDVESGGRGCERRDR